MSGRPAEHSTNFSAELIPVFEDNYVFLIHDGRTALLVDPGEATAPLARIAELKLDLTAVLLTHHHADHIGGLAPIRQRFPEAAVFAPEKNRAQVPGATRYVAGGEHIETGGLCFAVLALPGHTLGHVAYFQPDQEWLFSGDVLFGLGCGRIFEGTFAQHFESLRSIKNLPPRTQVFCAHEYTETNLRFLRSLGPLSAEQELYAADLHAKRRADMPSVPLSLESELRCNPFLLSRNLPEFTQLRQERNQFS